MPAILFATDAHGAWTFVNEWWCESTGQPVAAVRADGWLEALHPDDRRHVHALFLAAVHAREPFSADYRLRSPAGGYRWVAARARPRFGARGRYLGHAGVVFEISDRKGAELALRRAEQTARFLSNAGMALAEITDSETVLRNVAALSVPFLADWCAVDVVDADGALRRLTVVHGDPAQARLVQELATRVPAALGDSRGAANVLRTTEPELSEALPEDFGRSLPDPERQRLLEQLGAASYMCVPVKVQGRVIAALTFVVGEAERRYRPADLRVAEDLACRVAIAIENAELYQAALEADRRKDEFLATLSHELRTPLNAIVGWAHILRDSPEDPAMVRRAAETIHRNAQLQTQLVADILDVSRIISGKLRLDVRPVQLAAVVEAAVDAVRPAAAARAVRLEAVLDPDAGPVSGDAERLQQVVWNLLSNAIKFVPEKRGRVHLRLEAVDSHVRLTVEDNGPGIDPAFLPYVFERFRQADSSTSRRHPGLGLGLAIVRHLVELHGGTVRADNRAGHAGAIFTVELPRRSVAAGAPAVRIERHPRAEEAVWLESAPSLQGVRVVVVDDHEDARELVKSVLERCGADVRASGSVPAALAAVQAERPHVLLADIGMPGQGGYDLIRQLRSLPPELGGRTPAVALTAYASAQDRVSALKAGFQMHVPKPVQPAELAAVVASLTRGADLQAR